MEQFDSVDHSVDRCEVEGDKEDDTEPEEPEVAALTKVKLPCEEDYDTIKLISNGAYAWVRDFSYKQYLIYSLLELVNPQFLDYYFLVSSNLCTLR